MRKLIFVWLIFMLSACTTTKYVEKEIPIVETRIEYKDKLVYDSINQRDSVYIHIRGDTVFQYKEKTRTKFISITDTIVKTDSIPYPIRVTTTEVKEVNRLYSWQKVLIGLGIVFILLILYKIIRRIKP